MKKKKILFNILLGFILILSTHIMELALDLCDEIVILDNGVLTQVESKNMNKKYIIDHFKGDNND